MVFLQQEFGIFYQYPFYSHETGREMNLCPHGDAAKIWLSIFTES
jgi:hypothetical protein